MEVGAELDRERQGRILEAVAFSAVRLLQSGTWRQRIDEVLERLVDAVQVARAWIIAGEGDEHSVRISFRAGWGIPGHAIPVDDPRIRDGVSVGDVWFGRLGQALRAGRPVMTLVRDIPEPLGSFAAQFGSLSFAAVPIFCHERLWGFLGFGETRFEREWSQAELETLKAAGAVLGAAIERESADAALRESEERFRTLSAAAFEGIAITDSGVFVDGNDQLADMLGLPLADLIGLPVSDFVAPEDRPRVHGQLATRSEEPYEHRAVRSDGSCFPVEVRARSLTLGGRSLRVTALRDVSARAQAEERQRRLEADLRQAAREWGQTFDAIDLAIVLADADARVIRLNRAARALAPSLLADAPGLRLETLAEHEPWRAVLDLHRRVGESGASVVAQARDSSSGRAFYLVGNAWVQTPAEPPWRVLTFRDVTDFTSIQEQLQRARAMETMGALVAGVAHEVRNPLFSISATVDAMESTIAVQAGFAEHLELLRSQVTRLTRLTRDLLDYGRPSTLRRTPTELASVVRRATRACSALLRAKQLTIDEQLAQDLPLLDLDGGMMEQAFENLLANAIQHTPEGSTIRVRASLEPTESECFARCTVEDEGAGLPPETLERIFEPFFTLRKGGTGLGLAIVRQLVEAHRGRVTAENREAGGARFTVRLPAWAPDDSGFPNVRVESRTSTDTQHTQR